MLSTVMEDLASFEEQQTALGLLESPDAQADASAAKELSRSRKGRAVVVLGGLLFFAASAVWFSRTVAREEAGPRAAAPGAAVRAFDGQSIWQGLRHAADTARDELSGLSNESQTQVQEVLQGDQIGIFLNKTLEDGADFVGGLANGTKELKRKGLELQLQHALAGTLGEAGDLQKRAADLRHEISSLTGSQSSCQLDGLFFERVLQSNLGGHGPDVGAATLSLESNRTEGGLTVKHLEFRITANTPYNPGLPMYNGIYKGLVGKYGTVVVMPGSSVNLTFRVFDLNTSKPIRMPSVAFTFFDLDEYRDHAASEFIRASGFTRADLSEDTEVSRFSDPDGTTTFQATTAGNFNDNPVDPLLLTEQQKNRAVTLTFTDTDEVTVVLGATPGPSAARAFTFVGHPVLQCAKTIKLKHGKPVEPLSKGHKENGTAHHVLPMLLGGLLVLLLIGCVAAFCCCC